jgi:hypothetical protein
VKEWGIKPWNIGKLSAKDLQDIALAEHAEAYTKQMQQQQARGGSGSINTKSGLENRPSKQKRIQEAING